MKMGLLRKRVMKEKPGVKGKAREVIGGTEAVSTRNPHQLTRTFWGMKMPV